MLRIPFDGTLKLLDWLASAGAGTLKVLAQSPDGLVEIVWLL